MPGRSIDKDDIPEVPKTRPEVRQGSEPAHKSLEFRAEVIPYDNCEDPNAPILAFSGDNMNIIFNIPKERFLKLAVAAIDHLGHDSDFKPPENISNISKQSGNPKRNSNEISKSRLSDVVHSLDGDNTNEIVNAYEEDSNETPNSKNKYDMLTVDIKSCGDHSNRPIELRGESQSVSETRKPYMNTETNNFEESANFQSALADSDKSLPIVEKYRESSEVMEGSSGSNVQCESNGDLEKDSEKKIAKKNCENTEEKVEGSKSSNAEHAYVEQEQNSKVCKTESEVDIAGDMNLSAHSLDISAEDCLELENAWPDIYPYDKTEEIPVTELKSLELKGVLTKYFKLEISNGFIVIKVTSGSDVLVNAAKYKELEKKSLSKAGSSEDISKKDPAQSFTSKVCRKSLPVDHKHADSVDKGKVSKADKNYNCESKADRAVIYEEATGTQIISERVDKSQDMEAEFFVPQNVKIVSKEPIQTETLRENSSDETVDSGTAKSLELDYKVKCVPPSNAASNVEKSSSVDETLELGTPNKVLGNPEFEKIITLKIEQKLEELDTNIPGVSPTERLRFTLNDSLKNPCGETEAKKQMEECVTAENLLKESETKVSLLEKSKRISLSPEKCPKEISQDEFVAQSSDSCSSNIMKLGHENKSESLNVSSNAEKELTKSGSEHAFSAENKLIGTSLDNSETGLADGDIPAVGKLISNDQIFQSKSSINADVSLEETNIEKVSMNLSSGDKDSFEDSALGNDLHASEAESLKMFSLSENMECKETNSQKNLDNVPCKIKENETLNDVDATSISKRTDDLSNELSEQAATKENGCRKESIAESTKLKVSGDIEKGLAEKKTPQGTSINGETFKNKLNTDINLSGKNLEDCEVVEEIDKLHGISEEEYTKPEKSELVGEISDVSQSSSAEKTPEDKSRSKNSEIVSDDETKDVKNGKAETGNSLESIVDASVGVISNESNSVEHATNESSYKHPKNKPLVENSERIDLVSEIALDIEGKLSENSFTSNMDSFMDTTVDTNIESASEGGDFESDDVKSIASESDDGKDSDKQASKRKGGLKGNIHEADEVDCAPTRVRTIKAISGLYKDVIPENSEVKNGKSSKARGSYLHASGNTPLGGRSLRSKSLDPTPQTGKGILHERKHVAESEEMIRRTRAKTPDIVSKTDLKTTARSSPRKFTRAASTEPSSTSKVESTKTTVADNSKSRANLDSSISTKRGKRRSKE